VSTRLAVRLAVTTALLAAPSAAAFGAPSVVDSGIDRPGEVGVVVEVPPVLEELVGRAGARSGRVWLPVPAVGLVQDDLAAGRITVCRALRFVELLPGQDRDQVLAEAQAAYLRAVTTAFYEWRDPGGGETPCPFDASEGLPAAVVEEAVRAAVVARLPRPTPRIPPGVALTGLRAYLVTDHTLDFGPLAQRVDLGVVTATVTLTGTGTTTVDWGDGTLTSHTVPGSAYPTGTVVHTYLERGHYAVQVIDTWRVVYDVDGILSGVLEATLEPVVLHDFPVVEYRAVRTTRRH
jgi:hypothetical protein